MDYYNPYNNNVNNNYLSNQSIISPQYQGYVPQSNNQMGNPPIQNNNPPNNQSWNNSIQQINNPINEKEYILLDGSTPNKKKKYVFVEEVDVPSPSFTLDDIKKIISDEFDRRFGEEK